MNDKPLNDKENSLPEDKKSFTVDELFEDVFKRLCPDIEFVTVKNDDQRD